jgi:hypothetical protein
VHDVYDKIFAAILTGRARLMSSFKFIFSTLFLLVLFTGFTSAQTRTTRKTSSKTRTATISPLDVRTAREKVSIQNDNVNFWINKLGPIAEALELLDASYAKKKPSATSLAAHENHKKEFVATIRNLRDDLAMVETEFRTKSALRKYLPNIQGVTDLAAQSEDLAIAGKFVGSKAPLRQVAQKLMDTLAVMPK